MINIDFDNLNENQSNLYNKIFRNNKKNYEIFLKKNLIQDNFFFLSNFLSKDIYSNLSYIGYCQIVFVEDQMLLNKKKIKITISNYYLYKNIKLNFENNNRLKIICKNYLTTKLILYFKIIFKFFFLINFIFWQLLNRSNKRAKKIKKNFLINLYDTTFTYSVFKKNIFVDRYYENKLFKYKKNYLCPENLLFKKTSPCVDILSRKKINCLYRFDFLNFSDYLISLKKVIFTKFLSKTKLNKKDIKYLIFHDNLNNICNFNFFVGLLNFFFFANLKDHNIKISNIYHKFENQSAGKGFVLGSKNFFPKTNIIGICDYFINYHFAFSRVPLKYEVNKKLVPKKNILLNKRYLQPFKNHYKNFKIKFYSFRYKKYKFIKFEKINHVNKKLNINVFLPIQKNESIKIINQIITLKNSKKHNYECLFYLKFHPNFDENFKKKYLNLTHRNIFICNERFEKAMKRSHINIIGASTTAIESILYSRPVLCPINSFFIYDSPLINLAPKKLYSMFFNSDDLQKKIDLYANLLSNKNSIKSLQKSFSNAQKIIIKDL